MANNLSAKGSEPIVDESWLKSERIQERDQVVGELGSLFEDLFRKADAAKFGLSRADFQRILVEVGTKYFPANPGRTEALELYRSLRIEDLALARACARGNEPAWDLFLIRYREKLYDAARSITKEDSTARELADSLYADLFGTETREGKRISKLIHYSGRGSLEGWLRAVLAQEFINRYRTERRTVSLEERTEAGVQFQAPDSASCPNDPPPVDPRLEASTDEVLTALPSEDRFILASYYLDGRNLAEIGRILGAHESTISRRLTKIIGSLSKGIVKALVRRGMSRRQAEEALQVDVRDFSFDVRKSLLKNTVARNDP